MARVARPGGTVAVIDMVSRPGPAGARHNELERLRDPSHTRALEEDELLATLDAAGVNATVVAARRQPMPAVPWLERAASRTRLAKRSSPRSRPRWPAARPPGCTPPPTRSGSIRTGSSPRARAAEPAPTA
jgi:hypothetical protein